MDFEKGKDREDKTGKDPTNRKCQGGRGMLTPNTANEATKRATTLEAGEHGEDWNTERKSGEKSSNYSSAQTPDEDEIDDWASCEEVETGNDRVASNTKEIETTVQRTLRSASGTRTQGKSMFRGKTLLFNIQGSIN